MTHEEARVRVESIRVSVDYHRDAETAHAQEDLLYKDFVLFIASEEGPHAATAREIIKTLEIGFSRWTA